jgi:single-strand DNA-binding protein
MNLNKVQLIGRVGKNPEVRNLDGGNKVANFTLATSEKWTDKQGEKHETTEWHNIVTWKNLAGVVEGYVKKGDLLYVEGKLTTRSWDDKEGNKRYVTEIQCSALLMLSSRSEKKPAPVDALDEPDETDSLPF